MPPTRRWAVPIRESERLRERLQAGALISLTSPVEIAVDLAADILETSDPTR